MPPEYEGVESMERYVDAVMSGNQVVGRDVFNAVQRHVRNLDAQGSEPFPYRFDARLASNAIRSFPSLFRHTTGSQFVGQPLLLSGHQAFIVGNLWGWRRLDNDKRRFRRAYVSMGRKQGKTYLGAGVSILLAEFDNEPRAQVFWGASKEDQAKLGFDDVVAMCYASEALKGRYKRLQYHIKFPRSDSFIKPLASDRPFDGLNPHAVLLDELHAMREHHRPFYQTVKTAFGARSQPLFFIITTAGDDKSYMWMEVDEIATKVASGEYGMEDYFAFIARMDPEDDIFDENNWVKSMPNLDVSVSRDYIRSAVEEARISVSSRNEFERYYANRKVSSMEQAIRPEQWDDCRGELSDWSQADVVCAAVDAGGRNDLGAWALVARFQDGEQDDGSPEYRYEVRTQSYIDTDAKRDLTKLPWAVWIHEGVLNRVPRVLHAIQTDLIVQLNKYGVTSIAFDPWNTTQMAEEFDAIGFEPVMVRQTPAHMHEPLSLFINSVEKCKITHDGQDPLLKWAVSNLVIKRDAQDRWMPDRANSADKIDPVVATVMALRLASLQPKAAQGSLFIC